MNSQVFLPDHRLSAGNDPGLAGRRLPSESYGPSRRFDLQQIRNLPISDAESLVEEPESDSLPISNGNNNNNNNNSFTEYVSPGVPANNTNTSNNAPGSNAPGSSAPGGSTPGGNAPSNIAPGSSAPGSSVPGGNAPSNQGNANQAVAVPGPPTGDINQNPTTAQTSNEVVPIIGAPF